MMVAAHHRHVNAFPLQASPETMAPRQLLWGFAVAAAVVLSIWLLVVAGLDSGGTRDGIVPGPMPEGPSMVQAELAVSGTEVGPAPGVDILPMERDVSPR